MTQGFSNAPTPPPPAAAHLGRIGRYVLLEELGRGGMGVVYRARDDALRRHVAIKMVLDASRLDEARMGRFVREARAAARLAHPGIVAVHEVGTDGEGRPFLVMDHIDGESLEALAEREPLAPRRAATLVREVALALDHAHGEGIVHRDVKPGNVLVGRDGRARLCDFGLARETGARGELTATGQMLGTPQYLSPEQARGDHDAIGPQTDVFSLGGLLYWAITGRPPFDGASLAEVLRRVFVTDPIAPRALDPRVHPDLETIAMRCLEKSPDRRYPGAAAVAAELERFLGGLAIEARPIGRAERALRWARRNPAIAAAVGLAVAALVAAAVVVGVSWVGMSRRLAAERTAFVGELRTEVRAAAHAFAEARAQPTPADEAPARRRDRLDRTLALGIDAFGKAMTLHALERHASPRRRDAAAREAFDLAMATGEVALVAEQWSVAAGAFDRAVELGAGDPLARARRTAVDEAREARARSRRDDVLAILERARSGQILATSGGREDAFLELVGLKDEQTVALLAAELDAITAELRAAARVTLLEVAEPTADEARAGETTIAGLAGAIDAWLETRPGDDVPEPAARTLARARGRIEARAPRKDVAAAASALAIIGGRQAESLGRSRVETARLIVDALGRIGIRAGAIEPLGRYLFAEGDEVRAAPAGVALCRLGGARAESLVVRARRTHLSLNGPYWARVSRHIEKTDVETALESEDAESYHRRARVRTAKGDLEGALADYDRAIELDPGLVRSWSNRALVKFRQRAYREALVDADRAVALDPGYAVAWSTRGCVKLELGDLDGAVSDLDRAIALDPQFGTAWGNRGYARSLLGDREGAIEDLSRAIELAPDDVTALTNRGDVLRKGGEWGRARADFLRVVELDPEHARARILLGYARLELGDPAAAIADLDRALVLAPRSSTAFQIRAKAKLARGDARGALADLDEALEIDPGSVDCLIDRGNARSALGDLAGAVGDLDRAVELDGQRASAIGARGFWRMRAGDLEGAIADLERAIELEPNLASSWGNLASARNMNGDLAGALDALDRAIELAPENAIGLTNRGFLRWRTRDFEGADADLDRAVAVDPGYAEGWAKRGMVRRRRGDDEGALADLERALELDPKLVAARCNRAMIRQRRGDLDGALADLDLALRLAPRNAAAFAARAHARMQAGDDRGALADFERALELDPDRADAETLRSWVTRLRAKLAGE